MRSIFGEGVSLHGETFPLPEIRSAALRKFRPSLKGRVNLFGFSTRVGGVAMIRQPLRKFNVRRTAPRKPPKIRGRQIFLHGAPCFRKNSS